MLPTSIQKLCTELLEVSRAQQTPLFVVGGYVRDLLLGHRADDRDIDFIVEGDARVFARVVAERFAGELHTFDAFCTAKVMNGKVCSEIAEIDFASARTEVYRRPGALPEVTLTTLVEDLRRRDFSVNAMALPLASLVPESGEQVSVAALRATLIDPERGLPDLETRSIRALHRGSFIDDPTRVYRAARYVSRLGGQLEQATEEWLREAVSSGALGAISLTRHLNECRKVLREPDPLASAALLETWGVGRAMLGAQEIPVRRALEGVCRAQLALDDPLEPMLVATIATLSMSKQEEVVDALGLGRRWLKRLQAATRSADANEPIDSQMTAWIRYVREESAESLQYLRGLYLAGRP